MNQSISAIDLFCGAGGLSLGLKQAGIDVVAGIDFDPACEYPYTKNIGAPFILSDVRAVGADELNRLWPPGTLRLLAGCAPCQPFSSHRRGTDTADEESATLLGEFARLVEETLPEFVTMENVTRLLRMQVFKSFVVTLTRLGYALDYKSVYGPDYGLPQERRRLILVASLIGDIQVPRATHSPGEYSTVSDAIRDLPSLIAGASDDQDPLHKARALSELNLQRIRASKPGGTWRDWPEELLSPCHRRASGSSFQSVYARMTWERPSPTITTQFFNFGTGRFGHPDQDRAISLREAAVLQGFPRDYAFVPQGRRPHQSTVGRLIGNAVPPPLGAAIGGVFRQAVGAQNAHA